jgi:hypothetical protein
MLYSSAAGDNIEGLRAFLHAQTGTRRFRLLLPEFSGSVTVSSTGTGQALNYRGSTFATRDSQAACHVQALLDRVVDTGEVVLEPAKSGMGQQDVIFLFGSRSNAATQEVLQGVQPSLFRFEYGVEWAICCNGQKFSLPDPDTLDPSTYATLDDYGVVARLRSAGETPVFVIAGLGGRATEGCGLYFKQQWHELNKTPPSTDFAVVLRFPAPFQVSQAERVASAMSSAFATG